VTSIREPTLGASNLKTHVCTLWLQVKPYFDYVVSNFMSLFALAFNTL
jgi:hypothetical protein